MKRQGPIQPTLTLGLALLALMMSAVLLNGLADTALAQSAVIGDFVWNDLDEDGIQDAGEPGVANVTLNLYDSSNSLIQTADTDASGIYTFSALAAGVYTVEVAAAEFVVNGQLLGFDPAPTDAGGDDALDSDGSGAVPTAVVTLTAGSEVNNTLDFGFFANGKSSLGNYVWYDSNNDGDHTGGEAEFGTAGIDGVLVNVYLNDGDGSFEPGPNGNDGEDLLYATRITGDNPSVPGTQNGYYLFDVVFDNAQYWIHIADSNFAPGGALEGMSFTNDGTPFQNTNPQFATSNQVIDQITNIDFGYIYSPAIQVSKTPDSQQVVNGDTVTFTIQVTNTGSITLTNVTTKVTR